MPGRPPDESLTACLKPGLPDLHPEILRTRDQDEPGPKHCQVPRPVLPSTPRSLPAIFVRLRTAVRSPDEFPNDQEPASKSLDRWKWHLSSGPSLHKTYQGVASPDRSSALLQPPDRNSVTLIGFRSPISVKPQRANGNSCEAALRLPVRRHRNRMPKNTTGPEERPTANLVVDLLFCL